MKKITITISDKDTNLDFTDNCRDMDFVLGIASMFDRLSPVAKDILLKKLEILKDLPEDYLTN